MNIREEASHNLQKIVTREFIDACEKDVLETIEHIDKEFKVVLIGDRSNLPRLKQDLKGMTYSQAVHFVATWEAGIMRRYVNK